MKTRFSTIVGLAAGLLVGVSTAVHGQFQYTARFKDGTAIKITGYTGPGGDVVIPETIEGKPVASVGERAFEGCTSLTSITIPNSVTTIGGSAFWGCTGLTSIDVDALNPIYSSFDGALLNKTGTVFMLCPQGKSSVTIPDSVTSIEAGAFSGCTGLSAIDVAILNPAYSSLEGVLFNKSQTTLVQYPGGRTGDYLIPDSVTSIGPSAFSGCSGLTGVTIPNSVTSIGGSAFSGCTGLTSITIPDSVTSIGEYAFDYCSTLTNIVIPDSVTGLLECIFGCTSLTSVIVGRGISSIGFYEFGECPNLASVYFSGPAPNLDSSVFENSSNMTVYYLPDSTGWGSTFGSRPTAVWKPQVLTGDDDFGIRDGHLAFNIFWARDKVVVVEACADLANPGWVQVGTYTLTENVTPFSDPEAASQAGRFYRLREQ